MGAALTDIRYIRDLAAAFAAMCSCMFGQFPPLPPSGPPPTTPTPSISVSQTSLSFSYQVGGPVPASQSISAWLSSGSGAYNASSTASWLQVSPSSGTLTTTAASLTISVNPNGLTPGTHSGSIIIILPFDAATIAVTLEIAQIPSGGVQPPIITGIVNSASYYAAGVSAGEIVTLFGSNLGPRDGVGLRVAASGRVDNVLAGVRVRFDGVAAPLIYVSATQISIVVPYEVDGRARTSLQVETSAGLSQMVEVAVWPTVPAIFTRNSAGYGQAAALNEDGTPNDLQRPAERGSIIVLYATGEGQTSPLGSTGLITPISDVQTLRRPLQPVSVTIAGQPAQVLYAGAAPGLVAGVMQVNVRVPDNGSVGDGISVYLTVGGQSTQPNVTVSLKLCSKCGGPGPTPEPPRRGSITRLRTLHNP
jgi:trimeric autotransporter adhesin